MALYQFSFWWILSYIGLNAVLFYILYGYFKNNVSPEPWTSVLVAFFGILTVRLYPDFQPGSDDLMWFFGLYATISLVPFSQLAVITTKVIADVLINNEDFNPSDLKNYLSEIKMPLDTLMSTGRYADAIDFLKEKQKLKRYAKDYRICIEIATIAMSNLNDLRLAMSEYSRVLLITKKQEPLAYSLFRMADIYALKEETRDKAKECLLRLKTDFYKTEYGKNAELKLRFMEMQDKGLLEEPKMEITESDTSKPDMIQTDENGEQLVFGAETSSLINSSPGAYEQAKAIVASNTPSTSTPSSNVNKDYQNLLQRSMEKGGKMDQKTASSIAKEKVSSLLTPMKNLGKNTDSKLLRRSSTSFSKDSYQSLLNSSLEKNASKKLHTGKTGLLSDMKTGSLANKSGKTSKLNVRSAVMSDSEAYQMMLNRQGIKLLDQNKKNEPDNNQQKVNVREDGLTGFTRLNRMRRPKE